MRAFSFLVLFSCFISAVYAEKKLSADQELLKLAQENLEPLPSSIIDVKKNKDLINLGQKLYFETKLSINDQISCNSCHRLDKHGVDNEPTSPGHEGKRGDRNSPTVYNAALHLAQFWDGRAEDVEAQALGPILNPVEMGMPSEKAVEEKLSKDKEYVALFKKVFPEDKGVIKYNKIGKAIGAFERTLLTPARLDDFLKGNLKALNEKEKRGLKKFIEVGCTSCHSGPALGGGMYMKLGAVNEYPKNKDLGRYEVTKDEDDKFVFKVPSLRNVIHTAPYFHDGSIKTIEEAITLMAWHQLGEKLEKKDVDDIKSFLGSLSAKKLPF